MLVLVRRLDRRGPVEHRLRRITPLVVCRLRIRLRIRREYEERLADAVDVNGC